MNPSLRTSPALRQLFLDTLEETCSVKHAAEACGIARSVAYYRNTDLEFACEWGAAVERTLDDLLGEAPRRATVEKSDHCWRCCSSSATAVLVLMDALLDAFCASAPRAVAELGGSEAVRAPAG